MVRLDLLAGARHMCPESPHMVAHPLLHGSKARPAVAACVNVKKPCPVETPALLCRASARCTTTVHADGLKAGLGVVVSASRSLHVLYYCTTCVEHYAMPVTKVLCVKQSPVAKPAHACAPHRAITHYAQHAHQTQQT